MEETQPEEWAKRLKPGLSASAVEKAKSNILDRVAKVLAVGQPGGGTLHVLRTGFKDDVPASFAMMQARPELGGNATTEASAGSGKTRSIAWSVHRLATLYNNANAKVFASVIA